MGYIFKDKSSARYLKSVIEIEFPFHEEQFSENNLEKTSAHYDVNVSISVFQQMLSLMLFVLLRPDERLNPKFNIQQQQSQLAR